MKPFAPTTRFFPIIFSLLLLAGCAGSQQSARQVHGSDFLAAQMIERLSVMEGVAAYKYLHDLPVEDPEREAALLRQLEAKGVQIGLPPDVTRHFFTAQIEAAKKIQSEKIANWQSGDSPAPTEAPDLAAEVRPVLDRLSHDMLASLHGEWKATRANPSHRAQRTLQIHRQLLTAGYSDPVARSAVVGLPKGTNQR